eukprot:s238_g30.t1
MGRTARQNKRAKRAAAAMQNPMMMNPMMMNPMMNPLMAAMNPAMMQAAMGGMNAPESSESSDGERERAPAASKASSSAAPAPAAVEPDALPSLSSGPTMADVAAAAVSKAMAGLEQQRANLYNNQAEGMGITKQKPGTSIARLKVKNYGDLNSRLRRVHQRISTNNERMHQIIQAIHQEPVLTDEWVDALAEAEGFVEDWMAEGQSKAGRGKARAQDPSQTQMPQFMATAVPPKTPGVPLSVPATIQAPKAAQAASAVAGLAPVAKMPAMPPPPVPVKASPAVKAAPPAVHVPQVAGGVEVVPKANALPLHVPRCPARSPPSGSTPPPAGVDDVETELADADMEAILFDAFEAELEAELAAEAGATIAEPSGSDVPGAATAELHPSEAAGDVPAASHASGSLEGPDLTTLCAICQQLLRPAEGQGQRLELEATVCGHVHHKKCLREWYTFGHHGECPYKCPITVNVPMSAAADGAAASEMEHTSESVASGAASAEPADPPMVL